MVSRKPISLDIISMKVKERRNHEQLQSAPFLTQSAEFIHQQPGFLRQRLAELVEILRKSRR